MRVVWWTKWCYSIFICKLPLFHLCSLLLCHSPPWCAIALTRQHIITLLVFKLGGFVSDLEPYCRQNKICLAYIPCLKTLKYAYQIIVLSLCGYVYPRYKNFWTPEPIFLKFGIYRATLHHLSGILDKLLSSVMRTLQPPSSYLFLNLNITLMSETSVMKLRIFIKQQTFFSRLPCCYFKVHTSNFLSNLSIFSSSIVIYHIKILM
jgi:hypothetical protein